MKNIVNNMICVKQKHLVFGLVVMEKNMQKKIDAYYTDEDCGVIYQLFKYCSTIKEKNSIMINLSFCISMSFAKKAEDTVHIYMSSDKNTEQVGFHLWNNLWSAELPIIYNNYKKGLVKDIILEILDQNKPTKILSYVKDCIDLPLWRRNYHPLDGDKKKCFVDNCITEHQYDQWRLEPPRSFLTYEKLKRLALFWKFLAKKSKL